MYKKRDDRASSSTKGQITVFIIMGIVILFVFMFIIALSNGIKRNELQQQQEKIFTKSFGKESIRLYVQDCLHDSLEQGLILIGKQGRIWDVQPGGTKHFEEGITGITYLPDERVAYGITRSDYPQYQNAYPCVDDNNPPQFCQYIYPDTSINFGILQLKESFLKSDLTRYLENQTVACVTQFVKTNISTFAELEQTDIKVSLNMIDEGIGVEVHYPVKFKVGSVDYFDLTTFDFFYPTKFMQLFSSAVQFPLEMDYKYVDFNYDAETLAAGQFNYMNEQTFGGCTPVADKKYYSCVQSLLLSKYLPLGIVVTPPEKVNGDTVFTFTPAMGSIVTPPTPYQFRIARQNRPPALDYINRSQCITDDPATSYDYLVIKNDEKLGDINLVAFAVDPDEEAVSYSFEKDASLSQNGILAPTPNSNSYSYTKDMVNSFIPKIYKFNAKATDGKLDDFQDVMVLVDRPIEMWFKLYVPYTFSEGNPTNALKNYDQIFSGTNYFVSKEDPIFVTLTTPAPSVTNLIPEINFIYSADGTTYPFISSNYLLSYGLQSLTYSLPTGTTPPTENMDYYFGDNPIKQIMDTSIYPLNPFNQQQSPRANLQLNYNMNYCGTTASEKSTQATVYRVNCFPHVNPSHPFAYPYEKIKIDPVTKAPLPDEAINPFLATHSCCGGLSNAPQTWDLRGSEHICFESPTPKCTGKIQEYEGRGIAYQGYVLEQNIDYCSGARGNICGSGTPSDKARLWRENNVEVLRCGDPTVNGCNNVKSQCKNSLSWGFVDTNNDNINDVWCHGTMGCQTPCYSEVVADVGSEVASINHYYDMNSRAKSQRYTSDSDLKVHCGCQPEDITANSFCDTNLDGTFEGTCKPFSGCTP